VLRRHDLDFSEPLEGEQGRSIEGRSTSSYYLILNTLDLRPVKQRKRGVFTDVAEGLLRPE
jgi:hypothetical protein